MELIITIQLVIIIALLVKNSYLSRENTDLWSEVASVRDINHTLAAKLSEANRRLRATEEQ